MSSPYTNVARKNSNIVSKKYCLTSLCVEKLRNSVEKWVYFRYDTKSYTYHLYTITGVDILNTPHLTVSSMNSKYNNITACHQSVFLPPHCRKCEIYIGTLHCSISIRQINARRMAILYDQMFL